MQVGFYEKVEDSALKYAVVVARYHGKWVFCKHKARHTFEIAGGHREENESIDETAKRELFEETGALKYDLHRVGVYFVADKNCIINESAEKSFGMLYYANIQEFGDLPDMEMEKVVVLDELPTALTYPLIHPKLIERVAQLGYVK